MRRIAALASLLSLVLLESQARHVIELPIEKRKLNDGSPAISLTESLSSLHASGHLVSNHENYAYSTTLYLGSHRQPLNLLLDSGSSVMWVQSTECPNPSQCHGNSPYKSMLSTTFKQSEVSQSIQYGIGKVIGHIATDQVSWVPYPMSSQVSDEVGFLLIY